MKTVDLADTSFETCIEAAQKEQLVITRRGKPVALVIGVEGMDKEQVELSSSDRFWTMIEDRRRGKTLTREELDARIRELTGEEWP